MQHQPLELRHLRRLDAVFLVEMRQAAKHPADGVAKLAIGVGRGFQDFRADPKVIGIIRGADPHAQDVGAGLLNHVLRRHHVAERLRHLAPVLVEHEAMRQHEIEGRAAARAAALQQRGLKPAAVLVGAFQIHDLIGPAVLLALDAGKVREMFGVLQHEGMGGAGIEPDIEDIVDLLPVLVGARAEEAFARAGADTRRRRLPVRTPRAMRALTASSCRISAEPSPCSRTKTAIGTPQARWREITQSGRLSIMPVMRFSPCGGTQRVTLMAPSARACATYRWRRS